MDELLPCPFCGSTDTDTHSLRDMDYWASCQSCWARGPAMQTEKECIEAWNTRTLIAKQNLPPYIWV